MAEKVIAPNVYGIEVEYSCLLTFPGDIEDEIVGRCHSDNEKKLGLYVEPASKGSSRIEARDMIEAFEDMGISMAIKGMLSNGGRFYIDPSGPEYATPETTSAEEAVHRSFDGDDLVLGMLARLRESGVLQGVQLNRRLVDHNRTSRGVHLNTTTSLPAEMPSKEVLDALCTLNVVKGAMFGSGGLLIDEVGNTSFHHSPRLSITTQTHANYSEYKRRPLVRYPFKQDGEYLARVETVTSDALSFAWPLRASLIATNAVIRTLELGGNPFPVLRNPVRAAHIVGRFGYHNPVSVNQEGGEHNGERPHKLLTRMCEMMILMDEKEGHLDDEARQVLPEIIDVADRMSKDIWSVATQVESVARLLSIRKKMRQRGVETDSETICRFDCVWDLIGGGGIAQSLRKSNKAGWHGFNTNHSSHKASRRRITPPKDTRAKIRAGLIEDSNGIVDVDWTGTKGVYLHPLDTSQ